jgi:hypothetical protein
MSENPTAYLVLNGPYRGSHFSPVRGSLLNLQDPEIPEEVLTYSLESFCVEEEGNKHTYRFWLLADSNRRVTRMVDLLVEFAQESTRR